MLIPTTATIAFRAPKMLPRTSGNSSPRYSYRTTPRWPMSCSSSHVFITAAILEIRSAACCRTSADLLFRRHLIVPHTWGRYGFALLPKATTTVPNASSMTSFSSPVCSWNANRIPSTRSSSRRASTSAAPSFSMTRVIVSATMRRYGSDSSFRSSTILEMTSELPTLTASSRVVSTSLR